MEMEGAPALDGIPPPPPAQLPQLHQQVQDLQDRRVPELERHITNLQKQVEELRQVVNPLVQQMAHVTAVDAISDSGAAPNTSAESSGGSSEQPALILRLRGNASK